MPRIQIKTKTKTLCRNSHAFFAGDIKTGKTRMMSTIRGKSASFGKGAEILRSGATARMRHTCPVRDDEREKT